MSSSEWQSLPQEDLPGWDPDGPAAEADYAYADEYVNALDEGREHECGATEGRHVMEILMGVLEAGVTGRRVDLPQEDRGHPLETWLQQAGLPLPEPGPRPYGEWLAVEDARLERGAD